MKRFYSDILGKYVLVRKRSGNYFGKVISTDAKSNTLVLKNSFGRVDEVSLVLDNYTLFIASNTIDKFFGEDSEIHFNAPNSYFETLSSYIRSCYGLCTCPNTRSEREIKVSITNLVSDTNLHWKDGYVVGIDAERYFKTSKVDFPTLMGMSQEISKKILDHYPEMDTTALCVSIYGECLYIDDTGIYIPIPDQFWKETIINIVNRTYYASIKNRIREYSIAFHNGSPCLMISRTTPKYTYTLIETMLNHGLLSLSFPMKTSSFCLYRVNNSASAVYFKDLNTALESMYPCYKNIDLYPTIYISDELNVVLKNGTYCVEGNNKTTQDVALPSVRDLTSCLRPVNRKDASTMYYLPKEIYQNRIQIYDTLENLLNSYIQRGSIKKLIKHFYDIYYLQVSNGYFLAILGDRYKLYRCRKILSSLEECMFYAIECTKLSTFQFGNLDYIIETRSNGHTYYELATVRTSKEASEMLINSIPKALENGEPQKSYICVEEDTYITGIEDSFSSVKVSFIYKNMSYCFLYQKDTYNVVQYNTPIGWDSVRCAKFLLTIQNLFGVSLTESLPDLTYCIYSYNEGQDRINISKSQPIDTCKSLLDCKRLVRNRKGNNFLIVLFSKESIKAMYKMNKKGNYVKITGNKKKGA